MAAILKRVELGVARLTINRPEFRNAVTGENLQEMAEFVQSVSPDPAVKALLINGTGPHFMAGGDVKSFGSALEMEAEHRRANFEQRSRDAAPLWLALDAMPQPVVVAVRGFAAGAAMSLVAGADLAIASETSRFVLAHVGIGLVADAASSYHLPRAIGLRRAKQMALLGDLVDAQAALAMGLVNWVVPDECLEAETEALLARLTHAPSISLAAAKGLMIRSLASSLVDQIEAEGRAVGACAASHDLAEGIRAFIEKRKPIFTGA